MTSNASMTENARASSVTPTVLATPAAKRACDCCHKRKVKCIGDGSRPCRNCAVAGLTCTYNAVPQKKGPKGSRAKIISELRENQQRHSQQSPTVSSFGPIPHTGLPAGQYPLNMFGPEPIRIAEPFTRTPGLLSFHIINACVEFYFRHMYPSQPILHRERLAGVISQMDTNVEAYCLVTSLCAYVLIQPNMALPIPESPSEANPPVLPSGQVLVHETLRVRKGIDYIEDPSVWSVVTSFYLFGSHFCLDKNNTAWFHLREATTMAHVIRMHEEDSYTLLDSIDASMRRRLYWLLFVTERAYALQRHRPLTLYTTIGLPTADNNPEEAAQLEGFLQLVKLFRPFDDTFVGFWNKTREGCTTGWLIELQQQLAGALPAYLQTTETQAVDLRVSQQWLKTMIWQLSISHGYLSSHAPDKSMSFNYPFELAHELLGNMSGFSQLAMEVHGIGLIEKIFDVTCTLVDVMACVPMQKRGFAFGPQDHLNQFLNVVANLRGGKDRYLPLLTSKINDTLPSSTSNLSYPISFDLGEPQYLQMQRRALEDGHQTPYDSQPSSNSASKAATPFGSPPPGSRIATAHVPVALETLSVAQSPGLNSHYAPQFGAPTSYPGSAVGQEDLMSPTRLDSPPSDLQPHGYVISQ